MVVRKSHDGNPKADINILSKAFVILKIDHRAITKERVTVQRRGDFFPSSELSMS